MTTTVLSGKRPLGGGRAAADTAMGSAETPSPSQISANDDGPVRRKRPAAASPAPAVAARPRGRPRKVRVEQKPPESLPLSVAVDTDKTEEKQQSQQASEDEDNSVTASILARAEVLSDARGGDASVSTGAPEESKQTQQDQPAQQKQQAVLAESATREDEQANLAQEATAAPPLLPQANSATSEGGSTASSSLHKSVDFEPQEQEHEIDRSHPQTEPAAKNPKTRSRISSASARNLFQFTCKTLQSQRLEYEVRARELGERTALLTAEREKWEKKIRSVKRQLRDFGHPVDALEPDGDGASGTNAFAGGNGILSTGAGGSADTYLLANADWNMAPSSVLTTTTTTRGANMDTSLVTMRDALSSRASGFSGAGVGGIADAHIPVSIQHLEVQIRDTLKARKRMVMDMMRDLQGVHGSATRARGSTSN